MPLSDVTGDDLPRVGGKAAPLGALLGAGFPVPAGVCVTTAAFQVAIEPVVAAIDTALAGADMHDATVASRVATAIAGILGDLRVPDGVTGAVEAALGTLGPGPFAVRSSAVGEDRTDASFAGQYDTVIGVRERDEVLQAIVTCWRSFYSANALAARARAGAVEGDAMAVLIQPIVVAECAGVALSVDPVEGSRECATIDAAWGLGVGVVDGSAPTDTYWVRRRDRAVDRRTVTVKDTRLELRDGLLERARVPDERQRAACLPDAWATRVAELALAAEWFAGRAQDIEWAIAAGRLWLLQSRPVTGVREEVAAVPPFPVEWREGEDRRFWSLVEGPAPGSLQPLVRDCLAIDSEAWNEAAQFSGQGDVWEMRAFGGRLYRAARNTIMGDGDRRVRSRAMDGMARRLLQQHGLTSWDLWGPEIERETDRLRAFDLAGASADALLMHYQDTLGAFRRHWMVHWLMMWIKEPLVDAYSAVTGREGPEVIEEVIPLLDGDRTPLTDLLDGLYRLGRTAMGMPRVAALLRERPPDVMERLRDLPEATPFLSELDAFLGVFGERTGSGFGSAVHPLAPTWRETPELVLALTSPYLDESSEKPSVGMAWVRQSLDERIEALCAACPDPNAVAEFLRQIGLYRRAKAALEVHNHYIDQMAGGCLRLATMEIARRFVAAGALTEPDDILWLSMAEILDGLQSAVPPDSWKGTVLARKAEGAAWSELTPPPVMGPPPGDLPARPAFGDDVKAETRILGVLRGQGGSPGTVRGRARIVAMETVLPELEPGDILVARNAGPLWTPLFPRIAALVLDEGAFGQHACATARECGIPAVINTRYATREIVEGAMIVVDGSAGTVRVVDAEAAETRDAEADSPTDGER